MVNNLVITSNDHKWFYTSSGVSELSPPRLALNYSSGAPGSYFNVVGSDFPPNSVTNLTINELGIGNITTSASGVFTATITTSGADEGWYYLTARSGLPGSMASPLETADLQATGVFVLQAGGSLHPQEGSYPLYSVPAGSSIQLRFLPILTR